MKQLDLTITVQGIEKVHFTSSGYYGLALLMARVTCMELINKGLKFKLNFTCTHHGGIGINSFIITLIIMNNCMHNQLN